MIAIFKAGSQQSTGDLVQLVRSGTDLSSLAAFVRNEIRSTQVLQRAFDCIDFHIDGPSDLPSPTQLLSRMEAFGSQDGSMSDGGSANYPHINGHTDNHMDVHMDGPMSHN